MLGSQRLSELRDVISCPADANMDSLGMSVPSATFYIHGTFYNDRRAAHQKKRNTTPFQPHQGGLGGRRRSSFAPKCWKYPVRKLQKRKSRSKRSLEPFTLSCSHPRLQPLLSSPGRSRHAAVTRTYALRFPCSASWAESSVWSRIPGFLFSGTMLCSINNQAQIIVSTLYLIHCASR